MPVCPIDCIELEEATPEQTGWSAWSKHQASQAQSRYEKHTARQDSKALKGPKTHTQAKRLHSLNEQAPGQDASTAQPGAPLIEAHSPIDKAALLQKALNRVQAQKS